MHKVSMGHEYGARGRVVGERQETRLHPEPTKTADWARTKRLTNKAGDVGGIVNIPAATNGHLYCELSHLYCEFRAGDLILLVGLCYSGSNH